MRTPPAHLAVLLHLMGIFTRYPQVSCITEIPLDMAPNSFDDQYRGCADNASLEDPVHTDFASNANYAKIWEASKSKWNGMDHSSFPSNLKPVYGIAVLTYTDNKVYKAFNEAVRVGGQSQQYYQRNFTFKSFHFLLTRALQVLKKPKCYKVYRGVSGIHFTVSKSQKIVRLGQFSSTSLSRETALKFGKDTLFTIQTCLGASIENLSLHPDQKEVLIPPYEMFTVTNFTEKFIALHHKGSHSNFNCGCKSAAAGLSRFSATLPTPVLVGGFLLLAGALGSPSVF